VRKSLLIAGIALGLLLGSTSGFGQDTPRVEFFSGYSYLNADTNGLVPAPRQSGSGWEASVTGNFNRWFGLEADFSGYYKLTIYPGFYHPNCYGSSSLEAEESCLNTVNTVDVRVADYAFVGGPRFNFGPVFAHALVGGDRLVGYMPEEGSLNASLGVSASPGSLAGVVGGGVEWPRSGRWAVRVSGDYVFTRYDLLVADTNVTQSNFRASAGIVFRFGSVQGRSVSGRAGRTQPSAQPEATGEAALLGVTGYTTEAGFKITSVRGGSPAAQIALTPGDIVTHIDGREVHSNRDIEAAIATSTSGTIKVSALTQTTAVGMVNTEREVKVR
jgi:hypothetical protein